MASLVRRQLSIVLVAAALTVAACSIDVRRQDDDKANVDIRTPVGNVSVRGNVDSPDTGLPVYPGAHEVGRHGRGNADVRIGAAGFGMKVAAARFESGAAPDAVVNFYTDAMKSYGDVMTCKGDVDFRGRRGARRPVCKERFFNRHTTTLVAGTEERHRLVSIKPHRNGTEFAVVYIQTGRQS